MRNNNRVYTCTWNTFHGIGVDSNDIYQIKNVCIDVGGLPKREPYNQNKLTSESH